MHNPDGNRQRRIFLAMLMMAAANPAAWSQGLRERRAARRDELDEGDDEAMASISPEVQAIRDVAYGRDNAQRFDVYLPRRGVQNAPVILMAHGGGWYRGDKGMRSVVANKVTHWVPQGYVFISTNYRMLPDADPVEQAEDLRRALIAAQRQAASWGGDPSKFILMGHSAGAHLAALVSAAPERALRQGAQPWRGAVLLDSASLDVVMTMEGRHLPLHDRAFGGDPVFWRRASPWHQLAAGAPPMLVVASSERRSAVPQARRFAEKAASLGVRMQVLEEPLSHRQINEQLGTPGSYTSAVDAFISGVLG
ncbi:alpha/beta hydrolase [Noviherbaspirillum denitrificans]|nr:alpha/beta hydrolase [Noviherbaspirillum denitrificans]